MSSTSRLMGYRKQRRRQTILSCSCSFLLVLLSVSNIAGTPQPQVSTAELLRQFSDTTVFWQQLEIAKKLGAASDRTVLTQLEPWLKHEDRHLRGNAALVFASLGDVRGFEVIKEILDDRAERTQGQGIPGGRWSLPAQIAADRYYAVHLFGELKDLNAVRVLASLLDDEQVNYKIAWALGEIGGAPAARTLVSALNHKNPDVRVIAIESLGKLDLREAVPNLRELLNDHERSHFGDLITVAEAAQKTIAKLQRAR